MELGPGSRLGIYLLEDPLGRGGMGQVWKALDTHGQRIVAIKLLPPEFRGNDDAIAQVRGAFQSIHALTHQHIVKTIGLIEDPLSGPYVVMGYCFGAIVAFDMPQATRSSTRAWAGVSTHRSAAFDTWLAAPRSITSTTT